MKFTTDKHERYVVIQPHEEVMDGITAPKIKSEFILLNTDGQRNIILDLTHVTQADSNGLRCALTAHRLCKAAGGIFIIAEAHKNVRELIKVSKLDNVLLVVPKLAEAEDMIFMEELEKEFRGEGQTDRS
ncbi:anti-anti-sigma factor [bacterium A37T11]|nr:anti-anti-sigma factor [bacterium A37T11]